MGDHFHSGRSLQDTGDLVFLVSPGAVWYQICSQTLPPHGLVPELSPGAPPSQTGSVSAPRSPQSTVWCGLALFWSPGAQAVTVWIRQSPRSVFFMVLLNLCLQERIPHGGTLYPIPRSRGTLFCTERRRGDQESMVPHVSAWESAIYQIQGGNLRQGLCLGLPLGDW